MGMMIRKDDAVYAIGPVRMKMLLACIDEAWRLYNAHVRRLVPLSTMRGIATSLNELIMQQVRERFDGVAGTKIRDNTTGGRFLLEIDGTLMLYFKKLDDDFKTSNHATEMSRAFDAQEEEVADFPAMPRVNAGYQTDGFGTAMTGKYLAFGIGNENVWHHNIETGEQSIELEFPTPKRSPADQEIDALQKRRNGKRLNQATDDKPVDDGRSEPE